MTEKNHYKLFISLLFIACHSALAGNGQYAQVNGIKLYYEVQGQGEPLLLLHGDCVSMESFKSQIPTLANSFQVITVDSRAHGKSSDANIPLSYQLMASDFVGLLEHLKIDSAHILGWSSGGHTALYMAIHYPKTVRKLVLVGSGFDANGATKENQESTMTLSAETWPKALKQFAETHKALSPEGPDHWPVLLSKLKAMWLSGFSYSASELAGIKSPTLVLTGDHDSMIRIEHTIELFKSIPGAQLCILPKTSHFLLWEKPSQCNQIIVDFLKEAKQGSGN
jgi:pimeloyl-ACP methyl ester carboxylesterase